MTDGPLDPDARALWRRVAETVTPLRGRRASAKRQAPAAPVAEPAFDPFAAIPPARPASRRAHPGDTLDGGWDRRLRRGLAAPDRTIDLHGHTLAGAHAALEAGLARALSSHARLLLVVTGRAPREGAERRDGRPVRGAIRAAIGDWLAHSPHAAQIAAVRAAHPRHGGAGALYIVLRRTRG